MNILITQTNGKIHKEGVDLKHLDAIQKISKTISVTLVDDNSPTFKKDLLTADILIASRLIQFELEEAPRLKWIHVTSAGVNKLSQTIIDSNIIITNSSGVHPIPISEHVFGLMLMLSRGLDIAYKNQIIEKRWIRDGSLFRGIELAGRKLLVVGMGRIGERVAMLGQAFEMDVVGIVRDPKKHDDDKKYKVFGMKDLVKQLNDADFVVNALPSTEETKQLFDKKLFNQFKDGSFFINIGRGDTVVEEDLIVALKNKTLGGVGLDVTEVEPLPEVSPLWNMDNVIITPHISGLNPHYTDRMIAIFIENLQAYMKKKPMPNLVDKKLGY